MKKIFFVLFVLFFLYPVFSQEINNLKIRQPVDTIGFASKPEQMDEFLKRVNQMYKDNRKSFENWKVVISPHDDYSYVGYLYPELLSNVKSTTVILIGVCHKARLFNLENKIIFDSYTHWKMPYGNVPVSKLRQEIISGLPENSYIIHDSVQALEHSVEAMVPFLQFYNMRVEIISILIPYMSYEKMNEITKSLTRSLFSTMDKRGMRWGKDFAIVISSDAVHYGDEDWGGKNYAPYGSDTNGYIKAVEYEKEIINNCLTGTIEKEKIKKFIGYTVDEKDYKNYKWTWCGRYSIPFGLLTTYYLQNLYKISLTGSLVGYATSIDHPHIPVSDIGMGVTAPANIRHWVGYAAIGYK